MTSAAPAVKLPKVKLSELDGQHADLFRMLSVFCSVPLTDEACVRIAANLLVAFNERYPYENIRQTVFQYKGMRLLPEEVDKLALQIVARQEELLRGVLLPYRGPTRAGWSLVEIVEVRNVVWKGDRQGRELHLKCLTGHPAGVTVVKKVPDGWLSFLAYRIGFTRRRVYDYNPLHFVGLRIWAYLKPDEETYDFEEWEVNSAILKRNKAIILRRMRDDLEAPINDRQEAEYERAACPFAFDHPCFSCPKHAAQCDASIHRNLWTLNQ